MHKNIALFKRSPIFFLKVRQLTKIVHKKFKKFIKNLKKKFTNLKKVHQLKKVVHKKLKNVHQNFEKKFINFQK